MTRASVTRVSAKIKHKIGDNACTCPACGTRKVTMFRPQEVPSTEYAGVIAKYIFEVVKSRYMDDREPVLALESEEAS
jgi:hypothetical protein